MGNNNNSNDSNRYEVYPFQVILEGPVTAVSHLTTRKGDSFGILRIQRTTEYNGGAYHREYDVAAFGKEYEGIAKEGVKEGDVVRARCWLKSNEYKDKWYLQLALIGLRVLESGPGGGQDDYAGDMEPPADDDEDVMPF